MDEYLFFIDETNRTTNNRYFCLAGIVTTRKIYEDEIIPKINEIKLKYFARTDIVFHYSAMQNNRDEFEIFKDKDIKTSFWNDYVSLLKNLNFNVLGVYYDEITMSNLFNANGIRIYEIAFIELLNNYLFFLKAKKGLGNICLESRGLKNDFYLQNSYYNYLKNGSPYYTKDDWEKHLTSLGFIIKKDNNVGLQIADIAPSALLRQINGTKDIFNIGSLFRGKLYKKGTNNQDIFGLKKLI